MADYNKHVFQVTLNNFEYPHVNYFSYNDYKKWFNKAINGDNNDVPSLDNFKVWIGYDTLQTTIVDEKTIDAKANATNWYNGEVLEAFNETIPRVC